MSKYKKRFMIGLVVLTASSLLSSCMTKLTKKESFDVDLYEISAQGVGSSVGTITVRKANLGVEFIPHLFNLMPGNHGFHMHENPSCGAGVSNEGKIVAGLKAGGHYDPENTGKHEGPDGNGHKGDLPALFVNSDGTATSSVIAKRLTMSDMKKRSLMVHAGGDNYSDHPHLGGGGARVACGVIE